MEEELWAMNGSLEEFQKVFEEYKTKIIEVREKIKQ